jgi:uncharacterized protein YneF (UPF0154 family)
MKQNTKLLLQSIPLGIITLCVIAGLIYGIFMVYRYINYNFGYEAMVQQTVREMVKAEALKKP